MNCKGTPCASAVSNPRRARGPIPGTADRPEFALAVRRGPTLCSPVSVSTYESEVKRHRREIEKQQANRAAADKKVVNAEAAALKLEQEAAGTKQDSTRSSKLSRAASKRNEANKAREATAKASKAEARRSCSSPSASWRKPKGTS